MMNPESLVIKQGFAEPSLAQAQPEKRISSSAKVISAWIAAMQPQPSWCLTAPSVCATHGRKSARSYPPLLRTPLTAAFFFIQNQRIKSSYFCDAN